MGPEDLAIGLVSPGVAAGRNQGFKKRLRSLSFRLSASEQERKVLVANRC